MHKKFDKDLTKNIREYAEEFPVEVLFDEKEKRWVVRAYNEHGFNCTEVDLIDILEFAKQHLKEFYDA